ncbi:MAG: D-2-hydroxyacid dehydrogenase [Spirosomataceae bacterium]|jgi:glycerate dehydrogenase
MKIVFLDSYTVNPKEVNLDRFNQLGDFIHYDRTAPEQVLERAKGAEIILTNKVVISTEIMKQLPDLKYIGVTATGYNVVDIAAAKQKGIIVTNARNYSSDAVAQHVIAMMLAFTNRLPEHDNLPKWASQPDFCYYEYTFSELSGKILGLIGYGNIAKKVAQLALAFGMKVLVYKPNPLLDNIEGVSQTDFESLLEKSDFVSLHCPLNRENEKLMDSKAFEKMKKTAILLNTARGGLINETDLKNALENDIIAGAYLDVLTLEPPQVNHPFLGLKNCKISPHIAWASIEARNRLMNIVFENIRMFQEGKPQNVIE